MPVPQAEPEWRRIQAGRVLGPAVNVCGGRVSPLTALVIGPGRLKLFEVGISGARRAEPWEDGMGIMVSFWLGAEDGIRSHFLSAPLDQFENWVSEIEAEYPGEFPPGLLDLIRDVRSQGALALQTTDRIRAEQIDRMLDEFYGGFCDYGPGKEFLVEAVSPWILRVLWYDEAIDLLRRAGLGSETLRLWKFLIEGRPLLRDPETLPYTWAGEHGAFRLGYWTLAECSRLLPELTLAARWDASEVDQTCRDALNITIHACARAIEEKVGLIITVA
jgi:hypothetical protein